MRKIMTLTATAVVGAALVAGPASAAGGTKSVGVTNAKDAGAGSFRAAVEKANADTSVGRIVFLPGLKPIALATPVVYSGPQALEIVGTGGIVDGAGLAASAADAFLANGGGNLSVALLTIRNAPGQGLTYQVPSGATGTKKVTLTAVKVLGNDGHGVLVNDQDFPEDAGNPDVEPIELPNPAGSAASLDVRIIGSDISGNGFAALDRDGVRVNDGADGGIRFVVSLTRVAGNGGDGIELDERGPGNASFDVSGVQITGNGFFDIEADADDGMDVDESLDGSILGNVLASAASDNAEQGWDINENDAGDIDVDMTLVEASRNAEEGIEFEEDDDFAGGGNLLANLSGIRADGNASVDGDGGVKAREKGDGDLAVGLRNVQASGTGDGVFIREDASGNLDATVDRATAGGNTGDGIEFEENAAGNLTAAVDRSTTDGNGQDGVEFDENGAGNLTGTVSRGSASNNVSVGVRADQQVSTGDTGTLSLIAMALANNPGGDVLANAGVTVTQTP